MSPTRMTKRHQCFQSRGAGARAHRGIGVRRVQDLPLMPWKRLGGRGSYIQLYGTEGLWGCYIVEVPAGGALNLERHLYEKNVLVI